MSALPLMLLFLSAVALTFQSCKGKSKSNNLSAATDSLSDDALMDTVQRRTFLYFWEGAEPNSGLAPERYHVDGVYPENDAKVVTSGGSQASDDIKNGFPPGGCFDFCLLFYGRSFYLSRLFRCARLGGDGKGVTHEDDKETK